LSKAPCSLIAASINLLGSLLVETVHVLIDRRRYLTILGVRSIRGADCDNDHYLVVAKVRERLAVSKLPVNKMDVDRFNLKKLNESVHQRKHNMSPLLISSG
jgi:hypothetical protein